MENIIKNPKIGTVVKHTGWLRKNDKNYPCDVLITDGCYERNGRISNSWSWKRILGDGSLSVNKEHGYGSFQVCERSYVIETRVKYLN